jgi:hypothetical protein
MIKTKSGDPIITWQMIVVIFMTSFGIYCGGVVSGYFIARAEYMPRADARDKVVNQINRKLDQLPTQKEIDKAIKEDSK